MASEPATLIHSVPLEELPNVVRGGLQARSFFDDLGVEMRRGCVYCWLRREDDRLWGANPAYAHVRVTVDTSRCRVAEMDFASIALMYLQGQGGRPKNAEAVSLLAKLYELTSVPLAEYHEGMFSTPEVLVLGDIAAADIAMVVGAGEPGGMAPDGPAKD